MGVLDFIIPEMGTETSANGSKNDLHEQNEKDRFIGQPLKVGELVF